MGLAVVKIGAFQGCGVVSGDATKDGNVPPELKMQRFDREELVGRRLESSGSITVEGHPQR